MDRNKLFPSRLIHWRFYIVTTGSVIYYYQSVGITERNCHKFLCSMIFSLITFIFLFWSLHLLKESFQLVQPRTRIPAAITGWKVSGIESWS
jgi:hypothetical protein